MFFLTCSPCSSNFLMLPSSRLLRARVHIAAVRGNAGSHVGRRLCARCGRAHVTLDELDALRDVVFHLHELLLDEHRPYQLEYARVLLKEVQLLRTQHQGTHKMGGSPNQVHATMGPMVAGMAERDGE